MVNADWTPNAEHWNEPDSSDQSQASGLDRYASNLQAVSARIANFDTDDAGALTVFYVFLEEYNPPLTNLMIHAFAHRTNPGLPDLLSDPDNGYADAPFDAFIDTAEDYDVKPMTFVAQTIAESIVYADRRRYMTIMIDPSSHNIHDPRTAAIAESTAIELSHQIEQHRDQISNALINDDRPQYLAALRQISEGNHRMDHVYATGADPDHAQPPAPPPSPAPQSNGHRQSPKTSYDEFFAAPPPHHDPLFNN